MHVHRPVRLCKVCMSCRTDVNKKRYDTVTFSIGKREFYALVRTPKTPKPQYCQQCCC